MISGPDGSLSWEGLPSPCTFLEDDLTLTLDSPNSSFCTSSIFFCHFGAWRTVLLSIHHKEQGWTFPLIKTFYPVRSLSLLLPSLAEAKFLTAGETR